MAYLLVSYKLFIIGGILAVVTGSETTITYGTDNIMNSTSTPNLEADSTSAETSNPTPSIDAEFATSSISPNNTIFVTTEAYSNVSTSLSNNSNFSLNQEYISNIPDNTSSSNTMDVFISTEPQELASQTSVPQEPSAASTTSLGFTETSSSKVSSIQEFHTVSTPYASTIPTQTKPALAPAILIAVMIILLIIIILFLLGISLHRKKRRYSFDLSYKTAEDANIRLSSPILPGGFELTPGKENNKEVKKVDEDKTNHDNASVPTLNASEEINEKQNNCETEINHFPEIPDQEGTDTLEDWNFKSAASSFTDINLMDCVTAD